MPTYIVEIPAPCGWLSMNDRVPWQLRASQTSAWREAAGWWGRKAKIPPLQRAELEVWLVFGDARKRDPHNYMVTAKACIDGLVDVDVLPDDSSKHLTVKLVDLAPPDPKHRRGLLRLVITPIEPPGGDAA